MATLQLKRRSQVAAENLGRSAEQKRPRPERGFVCITRNNYKGTNTYIGNSQFQSR
jgi:hypothetical protein